MPPPSTTADDQITRYIVRRTLGEPIYRLRLLFFKLTFGDIFACVCVWVVAMNISDRFQSIKESRLLFGLQFDPWGWFILTFAAATTLSILHTLRPEGHIEKIALGWVQPRHYAPRTSGGDKNWRPSSYRTTATFRTNGADFYSDRKRKTKNKQD